MKKIENTIVLILLICGTSQAQVDPLPEERQAKLLGTLTDQQVDMASGVISFVTPLITIRDAGIPFSISAVNTSSGVKVATRGGVLGVGWNLSTGYSITRVVMDIPDEAPDGWYAETIGGNYPTKTFVADHAIYSMLSLPVSRPNLHSGVRAFCDKAYFPQYSCNGSGNRKDGSPDIYILQLGGKSFKFILPDNSGQNGISSGIPLDQGSLVKLEKNSSGFLVKDDFQTFYEFYKTEYQVNYINSGNYSSPNEILPIISNPVYDETNKIAINWNLTNVKSTSLAKTVNIRLTYEPYEYSYIVHDDVLEIAPLKTCYDGNLGDPWHNVSRTIQNVRCQRVDHYVKESRNRLLRILTPLHTTELLYQQRVPSFSEDVVSQLISVKLRDKCAQKEINTSLEYTAAVNGRVQLSKVIRMAENVELTWTKIKYYGHGAMFSAKSNSFDRWGYYTGRNLGEFPIDEALHYPGWNFTNVQILNNWGPSLNRNPILSEAQKMSIESITQSNGLTKTFQYELNKAKDLKELSSGEKVVGGLRILKITSTNFNSPFEVAEEIEYRYSNEDGSSSGILLGAYPVSFRSNYNSEFEFFCPYPAYSRVWIARYIHNSIQGPVTDFYGRVCIYGKVTERNEKKGLIIDRRFSTPNRTIQERIRTVERHDDYLSLEKLETIRSTIAFPDADPRIGQITSEITKDINENIQSFKSFEYEVYDSNILYGSSNDFYCAVIASGAGVGYGGCSQGTEYTNWSIKKGDRIQFMILPFKRQFIGVKEIKEQSKLGALTTTTHQYNLSLTAIEKTIIQVGNKKKFIQHTYKSSLGIPQNIYSKLWVLVQNLSSSFPLQTVSGYINGLDEYIVTSGEAFDITACPRNSYEWHLNGIGGSLGVPETYQITYVSKRFVFKGTKNLLDVLSPEIINQSQSEAIIFDPKFILTTSVESYQNKSIIWNMNSNVLYDATVYNGMCPAYSITNTSKNSYYADNIEGATPSLSEFSFGTETNFKYFNILTDPPPQQVTFGGPYPGRYMVLDQGVFSPSILLEPSISPQGVQLAFNYKTVTSGTFSVNVKCYDGSTLVGEHTIPLSPSSDFRFLKKHIKPSELNLPVPASSTYKIVAEVIAENGKLNLYNIFLGNGDARFQFTKAAPGGTVQYIQEHSGKIYKTETDALNSQRLTYDMDGNILKVETSSAKNRNK